MEENIENLQIANQGGIIYLRQTLSNIGTYTTNDVEEVLQDGTIIKNTEITYEQIKHNLSFDMTITLQKGKMFKGTINLELPVDNIIETGTSNIEINDLKSIVFKRI